VGTHRPVVIFHVNIEPTKAKVKEIARPVSRIINLGCAFTSLIDVRFVPPFDIVIVSAQYEHQLRLLIFTVNSLIEIAVTRDVNS